MVFIEQWLDSSYNETKHFTDQQKEHLINSCPVIQGIIDSSFAEDETESEEAENSLGADVEFQSYNKASRPSTGFPLRDSSAKMNVPDISPRATSGDFQVTGMSMKNNTTMLPKSRYADEEKDLILIDNAADLVTEEFDDLKLYNEDKENGGAATHSSYYQTAKFNWKNDEVFRLDEDLVHHNVELPVHDDIDVGYQADISFNTVNNQDGCCDNDEDIEDAVSLVLNELPVFKNKRPMSNESMTITPDFISSKDGEITYYEDLSSMSDPTYLPRYFQGHKLKKSYLRNLNQPYEFFKNKNCPSSADNVTGLNYCHYRYSRVLKVHFPHPTDHQTDVLCRLCRGKNWVKKSEFNDHLVLSHGILSINYSVPPVLLPLPKSLFITKTRSFETFYVSCPSCSKWIRLGNEISQSYPETQPRTQGLYFRYFSHYLQEHTDI